MVDGELMQILPAELPHAVQSGSTHTSSTSERERFGARRIGFEGAQTDDHALVTPSLPVRTRRFKCLRRIRPRRLASEGAVLYPEWAMVSNSERIGALSGKGGPATRGEGDMRQDHAAYSRRDPPDAATKSRAAGRLRPIREPGPRVICGTSAPDITSDDLRPCPGRYAAPCGRISPASRKRRPTPNSLFPAGCGTSAAFGPDDYAALRRRIISNYPTGHLV